MPENLDPEQNALRLAAETLITDLMPLERALEAGEPVESVRPRVIQASREAGFLGMTHP